MVQKDIWKRRKRKTLISSPFLSVFNDTVALPDDSVVDDYLVISLRSSVMVVATDETDSLIAINEYKYAVNEVMLTLPSGGIDGKETPIEAARRELHEETGYVAEKFFYVGEFREYPSKSDHKIHIVRAVSAYRAKEIKHEATEYITEPKLMPLSVVREAIIKQEFKIAAVVASLTLALTDELYGFKG